MNKIVIDGPPVPLKRHRTNRNGHTYDPHSKEKEYVFWEISSQMKTVMGVNTCAFDKAGPLRMDITFFMPIPVSYLQKKKDLINGTYHYKKPDNSNLQKFYEDAANTLLYRDDAQIAECFSRKIYDKNPRTEIVITKLTTGKVTSL